MSRLPQLALTAFVLVLGQLQGAAAGLPEPSLVIYGVVRNANAPDSTRLIHGTLTWRIQPVGGGAVLTYTTELSNINDQFSYVLEIKCETEVPGFVLSPDALRLTATPTSYDRTQVEIDGVPATFANPAAATFAVTQFDRGRLERVDLLVSLLTTDTDGNGLPDSWELAFFGRIGVGSDADPDGDGSSNRSEYRAGTDPNDRNSVFEFIGVKLDATGRVVVTWSSVTDRRYALERSRDLRTGYQLVADRVSATPPANTYIDNTTGDQGPYFYRVRVVEP